MRILHHFCDEKFWSFKINTHWHVCWMVFPKYHVNYCLKVGFLMCQSRVQTYWTKLDGRELKRVKAMQLWRSDVTQHLARLATLPRMAHLSLHAQSYPEGEQVTPKQLDRLPTAIDPNFICCANDVFQNRDCLRSELQQNWRTTILAIWWH